VKTVFAGTWLREAMSVEGCSAALVAGPRDRRPAALMIAALDDCGPRVRAASREGRNLVRGHHRWAADLT
jgi:hypothetical protein